MALGMFVFGFGVSPLAVVQETIIVRFFKSHGLGVSLALGLVAGKGASFISARTSYPYPNGSDHMHHSMSQQAWQGCHSVSTLYTSLLPSGLFAERGLN